MTPAPLHVARDYLARGWQPVPVAAADKRPAIPGWQRLRLTDTDLPRHFRGGENVGILLGEPSGWLVDLDLDHPAALELADQYLPATGAEFGRRGKPRSHRLYVVTSPVATTKRQHGRAMLVELRSTGCQTVFPGSCHPSGEPIEWHADGEPARVAPGLLLAAVNALADAVERRLRPAAAQLGHVLAPSGDTVERARRYLAAIPPAVSGSGGHNTTYHAACCLVQGFDLERDVALALLREWNQSCVPPWSDGELQHKVDDAHKLPGERGYLLHDERHTTNGHATHGHAAPPAAGPVVTCLADVEPRAVSWLWAGRIPAGRITLLVGRPGEGKSFLTTDAAARVTTGTPWPDGSDCPRGSVLLMTAEDDPADTIRPRLDAHGADVQRVHLLSAVRSVDAEGTYDRLITLADINAIAAALERLHDCRLVVVDPVGSFLGGKTDAHRDNEVRSVLAPIAKLAEKHGPAVLVVAHTRKACSTYADDLALGSRAFTGISRAVWHLSRDHDAKHRRLLLPGKCNLAAQPEGLAFSIDGDPPRIAWERDPVAMHADDALAAAAAAGTARRGPDPAAHLLAVTWLREALAGGPRPARDLRDEWLHGHGGSERTLKRAKHSLGVDAYRPEVPGPWWWRLEQGGQEAPQDKQLGPLGPLAENPGILAFSDAENSKGAKLSLLGPLDRVQVTL